MKDYVRNTRGRMFESDTLEFFSRVHPAAPFVLWIPIVLYVLGSSLVSGSTTPAQAAVFVPLGWLTWQLMEYFIHSRVFHWTGGSPMLRQLTGTEGHVFHHRYPDDDTRLVMPIAVSITLASLIAGGLWLVGQPALTVPFWCGIVGGYLWYDFMHWSQHYRKPLTSWGRRLRAHHMSHHFADPDTNFGISHMWLDKVLGTERVRSPGDATQE
jgi:sterol desaturase/sphingolipid hydroxylase (fatty acid hydroxylase superfamily)